MPFARARAPGEDVEDQLGPVDDLALQFLFELAQLRRRQLVVEDDDVDVRFGAGSRERRHLAAADEGRRIGLGPLLQHPQDHVRRRRIGQAGQLVERSIRIDAPGRSGHQADERRSFVSWRRLSRGDRSMLRPTIAFALMHDAARGAGANTRRSKSTD